VFINSAKTAICHAERSDSVVKHLSTTMQILDSEASPRQGERTSE